MSLEQIHSDLELPHLNELYRDIPQRAPVYRYTLSAPQIHSEHDDRPVIIIDLENGPSKPDEIATLEVAFGQTLSDFEQPKPLVAIRQQDRRLLQVKTNEGLLFPKPLDLAVGTLAMVGSSDSVWRVYADHSNTPVERPELDSGSIDPKVLAHFLQIVRRSTYDNSRNRSRLQLQATPLVPIQNLRLIGPKVAITI